MTTKSKKLSKAETELAQAAVDARKYSYCKYSNYAVGSAVIGGSGNLYKGCNVENVSYGLSNCGERTAMFNAISNGESSIKMLAVAGVNPNPCGACRQVMSEFMKPNAKVLIVNVNDKTKKFTVKQTTMAKILPMSFNLEDAGFKRSK